MHGRLSCNSSCVQCSSCSLQRLPTALVPPATSVFPRSRPTSIQPSVTLPLSGVTSLSRPRHDPHHGCSLCVLTGHDEVLGSVILPSPPSFFSSSPAATWCDLREARVSVWSDVCRYGHRACIGALLGFNWFFVTGFIVIPEVAAGVLCSFIDRSSWCTVCVCLSLPALAVCHSDTLWYRLISVLVFDPHYLAQLIPIEVMDCIRLCRDSTWDNYKMTPGLRMLGVK